MALAAGLTLAQTFGVGERGVGRARVALLPAAAVANAAELSDQAAKVVENDPAPRPTQWIYLKTRFAPAGTTEESWQRVDGRMVAGYEGGALRISDGGKFPRYGPTLPADPGQALAFFRQAVIARHGRALKERAATRNQASALELRRRATSAVLTSSQIDEMVFIEIAQTLRVEPLAPRAQVTLYRTLAMLPGVTVQHDVEDITGRPGIAFAMANGSTRSQIILDARTYRYLGWQTVADRNLPPEPLKLPPGKRAEDGKGPVGFAGAKAGSVLDAVVTLAKSVVDEPGQRG